ncbi:glycoside hydrolase family 3 [Pyrrhoderma noxium]|uniref:beta-glucosidase n=1 Tax=Pyrrhoderma noxium TaxID=2282107 RepID=A0A286U6L2_9AGAM|nr:glycoside hydrolase family 3 [Pyrrhoderma noxium]
MILGVAHFIATIALYDLITIVYAQQSIYGQCGGIGWTGPTTCVSGTQCVELNDYYSQCLPGTSSSTATTTSIITTSTSTNPSSTSAPAPSSTSANIPPEWVAAYTKAKSSLAKMSTTDKVNLATGVGWENGACVGNTPAISSIDFPGLCLEDSPLGVRSADLVSAFPPAINVAATFNRDLMRQRGAAMGEEFKGKGVHVALGPMMNIMRAPAAGRNWEGFGGDPYLSGEGVFETVTGIQSVGVQACAKHYINNEQEHSRETSSSNVDDRCDVWYVNKHLNPLFLLLTTIQNLEDWWATHSTVPAANGGLDMTMPGDTSLGSGVSYFGPALLTAIQNGQVSESRIDDMAVRILAAYYLLDQDSGYPAVNFNAWNGGGSHVNVQGDHATLIRQIGAASAVLLKNTDGVLPLKAPKSIAVVGSGGGPSSRGSPNAYSDRGGDDGVLAMGWGSGTCNFPYLIDPLSAISSRAKTDGTSVISSLSDTDLSSARSAASGKDVALVFITADSGEEYITVEGNMGDRNDLNAWHSGNDLVEAVASVNKNTVVVINSVGPIIMESWVDNVNVSAVIMAGVPGQEAGNSLVDVLYGDVNPSGRLPYTIGKASTDYSAQVIYESTTSTILQITYNEGILVDYRHFDQANIEPRFEFGFGLSYTNFTYSSLKIEGSASGGTRQSNGPGQSLDPWLHEKVITVSFSVENSGILDGTEIPQLYLSLPTSARSAPMNLKGFDSIMLASGNSIVVTMQLSRFDLSVWDVVTQRYEIPSGTFIVSIGASSRDIHLTGSFDV